MNESLEDQKQNDPTEKNEKTEGNEIIKRTILVADDEEGIRRMVYDFLTFYGHEVVVVKNGKELLKELTSGRKYDLVLTDKDMSKAGGTETDGIDTLRQIREDKEYEEYKEIPVILWSGALDKNTRKEVEQLGNSRCLEKSSGINTLIENIKEMTKKPKSTQVSNENKEENIEKPEQ